MMIRLIASPRQSPQPPFLYIAWETLPPGDRLALERRGGRPWELPELTAAEAQQVLQDYRTITEDIGERSGPSSVWWYTWSSSRDRYYSRILEYLELLARIRLYAGAASSEITLLCRDPYLASAVAHAGRAANLVLVRRLPSHLVWRMRRVMAGAAPWIIGAKVVRRALLDRQVLKHGSARQLAAPLNGRARVLLVTWLRNRDLQEALPLATYFGRLPAWLRERDTDVAVFGGLMEVAQPSAGAQPGPRAVGSLPEWLKLSDLGIAYLQGLFGRIRVPRSGLLQQRTLRALVCHDIHENRGIAGVYCVLLERSLRRFLRSYQPTTMIHACENNPWERACARAAASLPRPPGLLGYLHCAAVFSHTKYILTDRDRLVRPRPTQLICTGPRPQDILRRYRGHRAEETRSGCAWRFEYLRSLTPRQQFRWQGHLLVVFEGLPTMVQLLWFMQRALAGQTRVTARLRAHPQYPLERLLREAALSLTDHPALSASRHPNLLDDLAEADVVVYKGSTAAIEAGYLGIPLIHVRTPNLLTDDPLFEIAALKQVVKQPEELLLALDRLTQMSQAEFDQSVTAFRRYVDDYFAAPDEETVAPFLPSSQGACQW